MSQSSHSAQVGVDYFQFILNLYLAAFNLFNRIEERVNVSLEARFIVTLF
jgi:hypothetical protein